jgi:hypothetical protein
MGGAAEPKTTTFPWKLIYTPLLKENLKFQDADTVNNLNMIS